MGKSSFLMAMFNSYVKLPEGKYVYTWLVVSNMFYFPFHIWYSFPLTNSYFEKDGYCTTNQIQSGVQVIRDFVSSHFSTPGTHQESPNG
jgi:hypothetical protein